MIPRRQRATAIAAVLLLAATVATYADAPICAVSSAQSCTQPQPNLQTPGFPTGTVLHYRTDSLNLPNAPQSVNNLIQSTAGAALTYVQNVLNSLNLNITL